MTVSHIDHTLQLLKHISSTYQPCGFATSLALEDMVLTDLILKNQLNIHIFTLDTGRLPQQTLDMLPRIKAHYGYDIEVFTPNSEEVANYVKEHGLNAFYDSVELRKACCHIRKVEPLSRALQHKKAWLTGQRREQSVTRQELAEQEFDVANQLEKFNPLAAWTFEEIKHYIADHQVPYNPLHDKGYPSLGCDPCTRAIRPGEDLRAGRWWWEQRDSKECGLHAINIVEKNN